MYPILYRKKTRICFYFCLMGTALCLRLLCSPGLRETVRTETREILRSGKLLRGVVFLETGMRAEKAQGASGDGQAPTGDADKQCLSLQGEKEPLRRDEQRPSADGNEGAGDADRRDEQRPSADGNEGAGDADKQCLSLHPGSENPPAPEIAPFTPEEAEEIKFRGDCTYEVDKAALLLRPLDWPDLPGPKVLIIHSHSCESYTQCEGHTYIPSANYRTLDMNNNVVAVGDALADALAAFGVELIHDRTYNDYPDYNRSYAVAREKIQAYLEQYPSIVMVLDLHRDALEDPVRETVELDGEILAPLMLVIGTDEGGLYHPNWADNLSCGLKLQALANREDPELFKRISFRAQRFNGDLTRGSLIVEVGSTENTLPEAVAAMPYLASYIVKLLEYQKQIEN